MGQHWYTQTGKTRHTYVNAKGKRCDTTLRQARQENLLPSVTSILDMLPKDGLHRWKENTMLDLIRSGTHPDKVQRVMADNLEQSARIGSKVHDYIEHALKGKKKDADITLSNGVETRLSVMGDPLVEWVLENTEKIYGLEEVITCNELGYAGTADVQALTTSQKFAIIDFKSWRSEGREKPFITDSKPAQIAAYLKAEWYADGTYNEPFTDNFYGANVFFSTEEPGRMHVQEYNKKELDKAWRCFYKQALIPWQDKKDYKPEPVN